MEVGFICTEEEKMDDKKRVTVRFQYYQLCTFDGNDYTENLYDLTGWLKKVFGLSLKDRIRETSGIEGRLENAKVISNDTIYALNFMRLDVLSNTYIVEPDKKAKHVDLEENEYIGKNTVALYDPKYSILMLQCNRGSYGVSGIEKYINSFNESEELCYIRPISYELPEKILNNAPALKLDIRFANTRQFRPKNSKLFNKVIDACNQIECYTAHLEFGLGHNRGKELEKETIIEVVKDVRASENKDAISAARLTLSEDQKSSVFDLIDNIYDEKIDFTVPARGELGFETMIDSMMDKYDKKGSRAAIYSILRE